jgi:hypothetical protein
MNTKSNMRDLGRVQDPDRSYKNAAKKAAKIFVPMPMRP